MQKLKINITNCLPSETIIDQVRSALSRNLPPQLGEAEHKRKLLIACSGPSLSASLPLMRRLRKKDSTLVAVNGTHDWLIERGIIPDIFVMCDPRQDNVQFLRKPHKGVKYYIASQCHPDAFEALKGFDVTVWHMDCRIPEIQQLLEDNGGPWCLVGGGSTVGMRCLNLFLTMGYRDFHFFGLDSCYMGGALRSFDQDNRHQEMIEFSCAGKKFLCNVPMAGQAEDFISFMKHHGHLCKVSVYGEGLIAHINKTIKERKNGRVLSAVSPSPGTECIAV